MKSLFPFVTIFVFALFTAGCGGTDTDGKLTVLDVGKAIDNPKVFDVTEIAEDIEFIPLDGSVAVDEIYTLGGLRPAAEEGFYVVSASESSPVQRFDRTGKFVGTVGRIGRGPYETTGIVGIAAGGETGDVYIDGGDAVVGLDAAGRGFARNDSILTYGIAWHGERLLVLKTPMIFDEGAFDGDSVAFVDLYDHDLRHVGSIYGPPLGHYLGFPAGAPFSGFSAMSLPFMSDNGERMLVKQGRGDTLYQYVAGTLKPAYVIDLGTHTPSPEVFGPEAPAEWNERYFMVGGVFEGERYIIATADNLQLLPSGQRPPLRQLVFDRRDPLAGGFSATGAAGEQGLHIGGIAFTPCYIRHNRLVGYMRALDIVDNAEGIIDHDLKSLAADIREDGNPVVVVVELKKQGLPKS